ncbi:MAG: transcription antitermination factor NusB [Limnobacter sp.]|nr:transcription antitermination factor NusB [Limnobacter sp.]
MNKGGEPSAESPRKHGRNARRRYRELALQGLYQYFLTPSEIGEIDAHLRDAPGFDKADMAHYQSLLIEGAQQLEAITAQVSPFIDRLWEELSPVEKSVLVLGVHELNAHLDIPYRVVINEAVELTKTFGGTDAHKFVNGVLDKVAAQARQSEVAGR